MDFEWLEYEYKDYIVICIPKKNFTYDIDYLLE